MLKNFVIIKHVADCGNAKYLFRVPKAVSLEAGDKVVCDTSIGTDQLGICCCDSFLSKPEIVCPLFGTNESKMKFVTGKVEYEKFENLNEEDEEE